MENFWRVSKDQKLVVRHARLCRDREYNYTRYTADFCISFSASENLHLGYISIVFLSMNSRVLDSLRVYIETKESRISKIDSSRASWRVVNDTVMALGTVGVSEGDFLGRRLYSPCSRGCVARPPLQRIAYCLLRSRRPWTKKSSTHAIDNYTRAREPGASSVAFPVL